MTLKVAHVAIVTPGRCGLYETTRELVAAECDLGIDAGMYDPQPTQFYPGLGEDRGAPIVDLDYVQDADILVDHSGLDAPGLKGIDKPVIHAAHGRPLSSFLTERNGGAPVLSYQYNRAADERYRGVVTFWLEHVPYLQLLWGDKPVRYVPAPVDLEAWSPDGNCDYQFGGKRGKTNLVITCPWRQDMTPYAAIHAAHQHALSERGVKLHLYATDSNRKGMGPLLNRLRQAGTLGEVKGWTSNLAEIYRAADALITPNEINTRSVREAMACGCPVVTNASRTDLVQTTNAIHRALHADRGVVRQTAEANFNPQETARWFIEFIGQRLPELSGFQEPAAC